jgi:DNA-binding protein HU-beta
MKPFIFAISILLLAYAPLALSTTDKEQLIEAIVFETEISRTDVEKTIESFFTQIELHLAQGDCVSLKGFGMFCVKERAARYGQNPQTGETIYIPPSRTPIFKAGEELKDAINQESGDE